jgi:hypothetical protein
MLILRTFSFILSATRSEAFFVGSKDGSYHKLKSHCSLCALPFLCRTDKVASLPSQNERGGASRLFSFSPAFFAANHLVKSNRIEVTA